MARRGIYTFGMNQNAPRAQISEGRQLLYYLGMGLTAVGLLMFLSVFVSAASGPPKPRPVVWVSPGMEKSYHQFCGVLGTPCDAEVRVGSPGAPSTPSSNPQSHSQSLAGRAIFGFALMLVGGVMMNLGRAGLRGSGVILDPEGARQDLKPWNQAAGGMLDDTLGSSEFATRAVERIGDAQSNDRTREVVRVRCPHCRTLNDEDAKFCDNCGAAL